MRPINLRVWSKILGKYRQLDWTGNDQGLGMLFEVQKGIGSNVTSICHSVGDVVEQYTGLKDINFKEIYEGDIVTVQATNDDGSTDGMLGKIVYDEDIASFEFTTTGEDGWYTSSFDNLFEEGFFDIHVIGNMHTNPELLEAQHDTRTN